MPKRKIKGGILVTIGYILSPLSWWNDLFINIPLAYAFALPFGYISRSWFIPAMIVGYWITNITGFLLLHHGVVDIFSKETKKYTRKELIKYIIFSVIYTLVVAVFILLGWVKFPTEYFE